MFFKTHSSLKDALKACRVVVYNLFLIYDNDILYLILIIILMNTDKFSIYLTVKLLSL